MVSLLGSASRAGGVAELPAFCVSERPARESGHGRGNGADRAIAVESAKECFVECSLFFMKLLCSFVQRSVHLRFKAVACLLGRSFGTSESNRLLNSVTIW